MNAIFLAFGALFGFLLSRAGATSYDVIAGMFRFTNLHLMGVIGVAIAVAALGLYVLRSRKAGALMGCAIEVQPKASHRGLLPAGLVFGSGWALTGA